MARVFVRLSLENKLLAEHLRQMLSEAELSGAFYKRHELLSQNDEWEQFIYNSLRFATGRLLWLI